MERAASPIGERSLTIAFHVSVAGQRAASRIPSSYPDNPVITGMNFDTPWGPRVNATESENPSNA